jgi:hypothetical protein
VPEVFAPARNTDYCVASRCLGRNLAHVNKYGWHADVVLPFPLEP